MLRKLPYFLPTFLLVVLSSIQLFVTGNVQEFKVTRTIDGDTMDLENGYRVRLLGIDSPEVGQPFYREATDALKEMTEGKKVKLEKDPRWEKDVYGRSLRYVFMDGLFVNKEMVRKGLARLEADEDSKYYSALEQAEKEAIEKRLGIWSTSSS